MKLKKVKLNSSGIRELMKGPEVTGELERIASAKMSILGDGYETSTYSGKTRANVSIRPVTEKARQDNLENNTLLKAVSG